MKKENYHTHTTGSDGRLKPEELIKLAIKKKFDVIAITDHYRNPPGFRKWGNEHYSQEHYDLIVNLKKKYKNKIKILVGVEFDWISKYKKWIKKEAKRRKYDLKIISIHWIRKGEKYAPIEWKEEEFEKSVKAFGGSKKVVKQYYKDLREAIKTGLFDSVGHIDIIKMWNKDNKYFSPEEKWYKKEITKTLKLISKNKMKLDLNTSGWRKTTEEQSPSLEIIREAKKLNIPLLIGTDAHKSEQLEAGLKKIKLMKI